MDNIKEIEKELEKAKLIRDNYESYVQGLTDRVTSAKGEIPRNPYNPDYPYARSYIGTWDIETAKQIATNLREHGINCKIRGRGERSTSTGWCNTDIKLEDAESGAIYLDLEAIGRKLVKERNLDIPDKSISWGYRVHEAIAIALLDIKKRSEG